MERRAGAPLMSVRWYVLSLFDSITGACGALMQIAKDHRTMHGMYCPNGCKHPDVKCSHGCYVHNSGFRVHVVLGESCAVCGKRPVDYEGKP